VLVRAVNTILIDMVLRSLSLGQLCFGLNWRVQSDSSATLVVLESLIRPRRVAGGRFHFGGNSHLNLK
jgi:hypothetical protein